jgi:hypothetical protein
MITNNEKPPVHKPAAFRAIEAACHGLSAYALPGELRFGSGQVELGKHYPLPALGARLTTTFSTMAKRKAGSSS